MFSKLLSHCALILAFLTLQWRPTFLATIRCHDILARLTSVTTALGFETKHLLVEYRTFHGLTNVAPHHVPDATVVGSNFSEQLQDIFAKSVQYNKRIANVEDYQKNDWRNPKSVGEPLTQVKTSLFSQMNLLKVLAQVIQPDVPLMTAAPPPPADNHSYAKKMYGLRAIVGLGDWLSQVSQALKAAPEVCDVQVTATTESY
uniref:uncharacterized protein LOC131128135 n=1 Tax=Doryrhamphus excisus TaxID=161450 RepID=UPI0025AE38B4|nr:uncharacterized protein LOC131128135 [Doryrhamphus excisus]